MLAYNINLNSCVPMLPILANRCVNILGFQLIFDRRIGHKCGDHCHMAIGSLTKKYKEPPPVLPGL